MTITREQVFSCAYELSYTAQYPFTGHYDAVNNAAAMLRDLWQQVEAAEALISWIAEQDYRGNRSIEQGRCIAYMRERQTVDCGSNSR